MDLKIEDDLTKAKWADFARLKNRIDPREVVPALPNKYFPIVVRAASRDEIDDIPRDLYTVTVLATVKRPDLEEALVVALTRIDECQDSFKSLLLNIHDIVRKSGGGDEPPGNLCYAPIDEGKMAECIIGVMKGFDIKKGSVREMLSLPMQQTARYVKEYGSSVTEEERAAKTDAVANGVPENLLNVEVEHGDGVATGGILGGIGIDSCFGALHTSE